MVAMSPSSDVRLQQLLATDSAQAWFAQLTACFFDPDAKRAVLDAIRAGLPTLVPDMDSDGLRRLTAGVLQELCRQASRAATPPAPVATADLTPLAGPELGEQIVARYPYPVAIAYHTLTQANS